MAREVIKEFSNRSQIWKKKKLFFEFVQPGKSHRPVREMDQFHTSASQLWPPPCTSVQQIYLDEYLQSSLIRPSRREHKVPLCSYKKTKTKSQVTLAMARASAIPLMSNEKLLASGTNHWKFLPHTF